MPQSHYVQVTFKSEQLKEILLKIFEIILILLPALFTLPTNLDCINRRAIIHFLLFLAVKKYNTKGYPPCKQPGRPTEQHCSSHEGLTGQKMQMLFMFSISNGRACRGMREDLPSCDIPSAILPQIYCWSVQSQLERGLRVWAALNFFLDSLPPAYISKNKQNNFRYCKSEGFSSS